MKEGREERSRREVEKLKLRELCWHEFEVDKQSTYKLKKTIEKLRI